MPSKLPPLPEPIRISTIIKFFRYSFLVAGIVYGFNRERELDAIESVNRVERQRMKAIRDEKLKQEKARTSAETLDFLASLLEPSDD